MLDRTVRKESTWYRLFASYPVTLLFCYFLYWYHYKNIFFLNLINELDVKIVLVLFVIIFFLILRVVFSLSVDLFFISRLIFTNLLVAWVHWVIVYPADTGSLYIAFQTIGAICFTFGFSMLVFWEERENIGQGLIEFYNKIIGLDVVQAFKPHSSSK